MLLRCYGRRSTGALSRGLAVMILVGPRTTSTIPLIGWITLSKGHQDNSCSISSSGVTFAIHNRYPFGFLHIQTSSTAPSNSERQVTQTVRTTAGSCLRAFPLIELLPKHVSSSSRPLYTLQIFRRKFICRWNGPELGTSHPSWSYGCSLVYLLHILTRQHKVDWSRGCLSQYGVQSLTSSLCHHEVEI
jgi:hypothetical protein